MGDYLWIIPAAPCAAAIINGVLGKKLGKITGAIAIAAIATAFLVALYVAFTVLMAGEQAGYYVDPLTAVMLLVVTSVSLLVHIYSVGYMADDPGFWRFFCYLPLFVFAMLTLVLGNNFLQLFL